MAKDNMKYSQFERLKHKLPKNNTEQNSNRLSLSGKYYVKATHIAQVEVHTEPIGTLSSLDMESKRVEARVDITNLTKH
jgi:hypothetical protein